MDGNGRKDDSIADTMAPEDVEMYCAVCGESFPAEAQHCPADGSKLIKLVEKRKNLIGTTIADDFTITEQIGRGGMGTVYKAEQHSLGRAVAIKVIEPHLVTNKDVSKRFIREARLSAQLTHPNVVSVYRFGQADDDMFYLVMELLAGKSLDQLIKLGPMSTDRVVRIATQLCDALEAAHGLHIVHRDLKPSNIVILDEPVGRDVVKVLDFGIAKSLAGSTGITTVTRSDMILGTPSYIAPEAINDKTVGASADLYSFGVILYEMVAGRLPFHATTISGMLNCHAHEPPGPLPGAVPLPLRNVIQRLLQKKPADRYESAAALRTALEEAQRTSPKGVVVHAEAEALGATLDPKSAELARQSAELARQSAELARLRAESGGMPNVASALAATNATANPRGNHIGLILGALSLVLLGAILAVLLLRGDSAVQPVAAVAGDAGPSTKASQAVVPTATPLDAAVMAVAVEAATPDAAPRQTDQAQRDVAATTNMIKEVAVQLVSTPDGARVEVISPRTKNRVICASTPCKNEKLLPSELGGRLIFSKPGYRSTERAIGPKGPTPRQFSVTLEASDEAFISPSE